MNSFVRRKRKSPACGLTNKPTKEGCMEKREETISKIEFFLPMLTDSELRMVSGFIKGIKKNQGN